jgi:hypothetical protein
MTPETKPAPKPVAPMPDDRNMVAGGAVLNHQPVAPEDVKGRQVFGKLVYGIHDLAATNGLAPDTPILWSVGL